MAKIKTGSIDDITPEQWDAMNRLHLEEMHGTDTCSDIGFPDEPITLGDVTSDPQPFVVHIQEPTPDYKFREGELIEEFRNYINSTYGAHYGQGGLQSSEVIIDRGHGMGFFSGNVDKYNGRYGKKGTPEDHRKDIMKIIHYGFLMLFEHDRIHGNTTD